MSFRDLNLARRPFVNTRPVVRLTVLLWGVGGLLLLANGVLYWGTLSGMEEKSARLTKIRQQIQQEAERIAGLEEELARFDLEQLNQQVAFLNRKILERTFSWSLLFDRLAGVMPNDVRLTSLSPRPLDERRSRQRRGVLTSETDDKVILRMVGAAKGGEALLQFVDALFRHPSFESPNLGQEARDQQGVIRFNMEVVYHPMGGGSGGQETATTPSPKPEPDDPGTPGEDGAPRVGPVAQRSFPLAGEMGASP